MNSYQKQLIGYYAKHVAAVFGFSLLYCLSFLSSSPDKNSNVHEMYMKFTQELIKPVKVSMEHAARNKVEVA